MEIPVAVREMLGRFQVDFPNEASCAAYLFRKRWPNGFVCPNCGFERYTPLSSRAHTYECSRCHRHTSVTSGTMMHRSKHPLTVWFSAAWVIANHPDGISDRLFELIFGISRQSAGLLGKSLIN
jgi:predicted RNA-binding Zn-ribbon protein involved in translation (DUF1610 family)